MCGPESVADAVTIAVVCGIVGEQSLVAERETSQRTQQTRPGLRAQALQRHVPNSVVIGSTRGGW